MMLNYGMYFLVFEPTNENNLGLKVIYIVSKNNDPNLCLREFNKCCIFGIALASSVTVFMTSK